MMDRTELYRMRVRVPTVARSYGAFNTNRTVLQPCGTDTHTLGTVAVHGNLFYLDLVKGS